MEMAGGRPRKTGGSEEEERGREQKRRSRERRKSGEENSKSGPQERVSDDADKLEYNARQREMYERRKLEGAKERGRPRKEDGDETTKKRREQIRRSMSKTKQKLPINLAFLGGKKTTLVSAVTGSCDDGGEPRSILKSPKRVSLINLFHITLS